MTIHDNQKMADAVNLPAVNQFPLLRRISIASLVAVLFTAAILILLYRQSELYQHEIDAAENNEKILTHVARLQGDKIAAFLAGTKGLDAKALRENPNAGLLRAIQDELHEHGLLKLKIYDLSGLTMLSTVKSEIGGPSSHPEYLARALRGEVAYHAEFLDTFLGTSGAMRDVYVAETYMPLTRAGNRIGAIEVYMDSTPIFERLNANALKIALAVFCVFSALYAALFFYVRRTDRAVAAWQKAIASSEARYRALFDNMQDGLAYCKMRYDDQRRPEDFDFINVNAAFERQIQLKNIAGKSASQVAPGIMEEYPALIEILGRVASTAIPETFDLDLKRLGKSFHISAYSPEKEHFVAILNDTTERRQLEDALKESEVRYRTVANFTSDWEYWIKPDGTLRYVSPSCEEISGYMAEEFYADPQLLTRIVHPDDMPLFAGHAHHQSAHGVSEPIDFRIRTKAGECRWLSHVCRVIYDSEGKSLGHRASNRDVTARKQLEEVILESEKRYRSLFEQAADPIWLVDISTGAFVSFNTAAHASLGYTSEEFSRLTIADLEAQETAEETARHLRKIADAGSDIFETIHRTKQGECRNFMVNAVAVHIGDRKYIQVILRDITERKKAEGQIHDQAFHDALTKLPNRRLLSERLEHIMAASKRSGIYCALMFLDLDNFKPLNDEYGHEAGDLLLVEVARRISSCLREVDTVGRFGGDEFMVLLDELDVDKAESAKQAGIVAEKIRAILAEPYGIKIRHEGDHERYRETTIEHHSTSSIGVVLFINHEKSAEDIIKLADLAMYQAKEAGRNLIRFYDDTKNAEFKTRDERRVFDNLSALSAYSGPPIFNRRLSH